MNAVELKQLRSQWDGGEGINSLHIEMLFHECTKAFEKIESLDMEIADLKAGKK